MKLLFLPVLGILLVGSHIPFLRGGNTNAAMETLKDPGTHQSNEEDSFVVNWNNIVAAMYKEAEQHFYCNGYPINPMLVREFDPGLADQPIIFSVDLATGNRSNKYSFRDTVHSTVFSLGDESQFEYAWVGKTDNGIHVVRCTEYPGGTGAFQEYLFFSFKIRHGFNSDTSQNKWDQLIMTLENCRWSSSHHALADIKFIHNTIKIIWRLREEDQIKETVEELKF
jgi:hypothetical protein